MPCSTGVDKRTLKARYKRLAYLDFDSLPDNWHSKSEGPYAYAPPVSKDYPAEQQQRDGLAIGYAIARDFRASIRRRPEKLIIVVTHMGTIRHLLDQPDAEVSGGGLLVSSFQSGASSSFC